MVRRGSIERIILKNTFAVASRIKPCPTYRSFVSICKVKICPVYRLYNNFQFKLRYWKTYIVGSEIMPCLFPSWFQSTLTDIYNKIEELCTKARNRSSKRELLADELMGPKKKSVDETGIKRS